MLSNMTDMVREAAKENKIVPGFNVFGYEDAKMVIDVAEELSAPVILMSNKGAVAHMNVKYYSALFSAMAEDARVPVCVHLDHATEIEAVQEALDAGYTSVMYDGSQLALEENIKNTQTVVEIAKRYSASVEAEIGSVGYSDPTIKAKKIYTDPDEAKYFAETTGVDALAVAIGTLHRMEIQGADVQYDRLEAIQMKTDVPLVIHGSTGLKDNDLKKLSHYKVGKVNIGTALRMAFGNALRDEMRSHPDEFDRIVLFQEPMRKIRGVIEEKYRLLGY